MMRGVVNKPGVLRLFYMVFWDCGGRYWSFLCSWMLVVKTPNGVSALLRPRNEHEDDNYENKPYH